MPGVDIYNREGVGLVNAVADSIKDSVRHFGAAHFSVDELVLSERDFSFKFHHSDKFDELTNDIIVRIRLHDFNERRQTVTDGLAAELSRYIASDLAKFFTGREITVGVELMLTEIMWGTASTMD